MIFNVNLIKQKKNEKNILLVLRIYLSKFMKNYISNYFIFSIFNFIKIKIFSKFWSFLKL